MLIQLVYYSRLVANKKASIGMVQSILDASETNNLRDRITGFLIFDKTNFLQILEGGEIDVERTYNRICTDERHDNIVLINRCKIQHRAFENWAMGGYIRTPEAQPIYTRHGIDGDIEPKALNANQVIALARDLIKFESEQHLLRGLSTRH